jgi:ribosomal protein S13
MKNNKIIIVSLILMFIIGIGIVVAGDILTNIASKKIADMNTLSAKEINTLSNIIKTDIQPTEYPCPEQLAKYRCFSGKAVGLDRDYVIFAYKEPNIPMTDAEVLDKLDIEMQNDMKLIAGNKAI